MKISIVVTCYNVENYIFDCIQSVQNQTEKDIEIICVDDASTDGTIAIINNIMDTDARVHLINNSRNVGPSSSRMIGARAATGEYLYFLDGDDELRQNAMSSLYKYASKHLLDMLSFSAEVFTDDSDLEDICLKNEDYYIRKGDYQGVMPGPDLYSLYIKNKDIDGNFVLQFFNRSFFMNNIDCVISDVKYADDSPFCFYMRAQKTMCIKDVLYRRRFRKNSIVMSDIGYMNYIGESSAFIKELKYWEEINHKNEERGILKKHFIQRIINIRATYNVLSDEEKHKINIGNPCRKFIDDYMILNRNQIYDWFSDNEIRDLKSGPVIIYGAGFYGKYIAEILEESGIDIMCFVVTHQNKNKLMGWTVHEIGELLDFKDRVVVIATDRKYHPEIIDILVKNNFQRFITIG